MKSILQILSETSSEDMGLIASIANRARQIYTKLDTSIPDSVTTIMMDLCCWHAANPIALKLLLEAPEADFLHDLLGIRRHIDRRKNKPVEDAIFEPRLSACHHQSNQVECAP